MASRMCKWMPALIVSAMLTGCRVAQSEEPIPEYTCTSVSQYLCELACACRTDGKCGYRLDLPSVDLISIFANHDDCVDVASNRCVFGVNHDFDSQACFEALDTAACGEIDTGEQGLEIPTACESPEAHP